jgi:hypothetical protein
VTGLLWVLWLLGWPIALSLSNGEPTVMWVALAFVVTVTWHKGAAIRALFRQLERERASQVRVDAASEQLRVATPVRVAPHEEIAGAGEAAEPTQVASHHAP